MEHIDIPRLPSDLPLDDRAIILDKNVIYYNDIERLIKNLPLYASLEFLKSMDLNLVRMICQFRKLKKVYAIPKLQGAERYEWFLNFFTNHKCQKFHPKIVRNEMLQSTRFCSYFFSGAGYLVDEYDKEDIIGSRTYAYRKEIEKLKIHVPKVYITEKVGELAQPLEKNLTRKLMREYTAELESRFAKGRISKRDLNNLEMGIRYFCTTGYKAVKSSNIKEDIGLTALSCAVPAEQVLLYSNDSDVHALALFANKQFHLGNKIVALNLRSDRSK